MHGSANLIKKLVTNSTWVVRVAGLEPQADSLVLYSIYLTNNVIHMSLYSQTERRNVSGYYTSICLSERKKEPRHLWIYEQTPLFPVQYAVLCHASCVACFAPLAYVCRYLIVTPFASQCWTHPDTVSCDGWAHSQVVIRRHTIRRPCLLIV